MGPGSRDDFRVAIICALPLEAAAVLNLFDQRYDKDGSKYGKQEGDNNAYSTGLIGRHDVVLVHMPSMGVYSATRVASNIRLSFKKIRLALVVGVCGGAPLEQSIILGDVIISDSIVEFYTGRQYSDGVQARKGVKHSLGRPSPEIRSLLSKFEVPQLRQDLEDKIQYNLAELHKKSDTARYPGVEYDRLFAASYRHMHRQEASQKECLCSLSRSHSDPVCSEALESNCDSLGCDREAPNTPSRLMRLGSDIPTPLVHIGTVAATAVMKCGEHRDTIASKHNVIAFEMEGAGVWENLPCVIIKGVCDYADSHKNKKWRDYAAATAASAAKAFLGHWDTNQHNPIAAEGSSGKRPVSLGEENEAGTSKRVRRESFSRRQSPVSDRDDRISSERHVIPALVGLDARKLLLEALNFEQLDARHATIKTAHAATCEWLLSKEEYMDWQNEQKLLEHHGFLWIKGKPGAGKSTIMKFAYTNADRGPRESTAISYFFNARGERLEKSTSGMYRSLLFQLLSKLPGLQAVLNTTEAAKLQNTSPDLWTIETLQTLFRQAIQNLGNGHLTCFVDALDECENNEDQVREMVSFFEELGECAVKDKIRFLVCFSSRHYPHITIARSAELILELQQGHSEDITKYINSKLKVGRSKRVEMIKTDIQKKSQGIFLWVVLVVPILQQAYDDGKVHALVECLKTIPKDLDELFRGILGRDARNMESLVLCLRWILYAERPLSAEELYFAMLSASETGPVAAWDPEDITPEDIGRFILSSSKGLAEPTRDKTSTIQFIHESVRDFLLKENGFAALQMGVGITSAGPIHDVLKKHCQRYFVSVTTDHCLGSSNRIARVFPFLNYSIRYVFNHAELAASHGIPQKHFLRDFPLEQWISLHDHTEQYKIRRYGTGTSLLYILTERCLLHLFRIEINRSQSVNAKGGRYDFPILAAAAINNTQMLELLLEHGADPDKSGKESKHALIPAVNNSNASAVQTLLKHGAMISSSKLCFNLLSHAVEKGDASILKLFLQDREFLAVAKLLTKQESWGLFQTAVKNQDHTSSEMLIDSGVVGPNHQDELCHALVAASEHGKDTLVRVIVDKRGPYYAGSGMVFPGPAFLKAVQHNHETTVRILLENSIDVNAVDDYGDTGLHHACRQGNEAIVRILLNNGADINATNKSGNTVLHHACRQRNWVIVGMLLDKGTNINAIDTSGSTGLHLACHHGIWATVGTLLSNGADINAFDTSGSTGLHLACRQGETAVVRILLDNGADIDVVDMTNQTGLRFACHNGNKALVRILPDNGANVNVSNPLYAALDSWNMSQIIISSLLVHGADPNQYSDSYYWNLPLHRALVRGMTNMVKLLLDHGANANKPSRKYANAFSASNACEDPEARTACEALLPEESVVRSPVIDLN